MSVHERHLLDVVFESFINTNKHTQTNFTFKDLLNLDFSFGSCRYFEYQYNNLTYVASIHTFRQADEEWMQIKLNLLFPNLTNVLKHDCCPTVPFIEVITAGIYDVGVSIFESKNNGLHVLLFPEKQDIPFLRITLEHGEPIEGLNRVFMTKTEKQTLKSKNDVINFLKQCR